METDKEVRIKVQHLYNVSAFGETHEAWLIFVDGRYRATFRHESDFHLFMDVMVKGIKGKIVMEQVYNDTVGP